LFCSQLFRLIRSPLAVPRYFALALLAGGSCIILSLVALRGRLIGILSGLLALAAPDAVSGDFTMGASLCCAATCARAADPVAQKSAVAVVIAAVSVACLILFI
jgi:hypothetical protein